MNIEHEKMRVIIDYFTEHFPLPYMLEAVPITRPQSTVHDDRTLRVFLDGKIAHLVIVSSALPSDVITPLLDDASGERLPYRVISVC